MGFEESTTEENTEKSTGPPDDTPESYWVWAGCDSMLTPYMAAEFRDLRETGVEDALVVATLEEAMRHQAKHPWCYAKRLLDQAAAQHVTTFAEWEKTHIKNAFAAEGGSEKMRTLNADQLKAVLSMESSLGHIHTLADVENTIDYLAKEEPEAVAGVEKFNIFDTPWAGKIQAAFPKSFVNMQNELIFSQRSNSCFRLEDVSDETQMKAKILEWLTRTAIKGISPKERKLHFEGINKLLGTNFTLEEMTDIYTYLGNGIKHDLCVKFVESGYDMTLLPKEA